MQKNPGSIDPGFIYLLLTYDVVDCHEVEVHHLDSVNQEQQVVEREFEVGLMGQQSIDDDKSIDIECRLGEMAIFAQITIQSLRQRV